MSLAKFEPSKTTIKMKLFVTLLILASQFGLPISTTYVSVGSIFGVGLTSKKSNIRVFSQILLSWILTLPTAAIISGVTYRLLQG